MENEEERRNKAGSNSSLGAEESERCERNMSVR